MRELSLNILDIAENSVKAKATLIEIEVAVLKKQDLLYISVADNGCGMSEEFLKSVVDPFTTTRTTRKVGMGIPLFKEASETAGGEFGIESTLGVGTKTHASFQISNIDRMPLGSVAETMATLIMGSPNIDFKLIARNDEREYVFSTVEVKEVLGEQDLSDNGIIAYLKDLINENVMEITGGEI